MPLRGRALSARRSAAEADAPATRRALPPMGKSTDRKRVRGVGGRGRLPTAGTGFPLGVMECSGINSGGGCTTLSVPGTTELHNLFFLHNFKIYPY